MKIPITKKLQTLIERLDDIDPLGADIAREAAARVQELEAGWIAVEDKEPPKLEEIWIRGDGYELKATLEIVDYNEFSDRSCWGWVLSNRALCLDDDIAPAHWRYVTPPEDSSDEG